MEYLGLGRDFAESLDFFNSGEEILRSDVLEKYIKKIRELNEVYRKNVEKYKTMAIPTGKKKTARYYQDDFIDKRFKLLLQDKFRCLSYLFGIMDDKNKDEWGEITILIIKITLEYIDAILNLASFEEYRDYGSKRIGKKTEYTKSKEIFFEMLNNQNKKDKKDFEVSLYGSLFNKKENSEVKYITQKQKEKLYKRLNREAPKEVKTRTPTQNHEWMCDILQNCFNLLFHQWEFFVNPRVTYEPPLNLMLKRESDRNKKNPLEPLRGDTIGYFIYGISSIAKKEIQKGKHENKSKLLNKIDMQDDRVFYYILLYLKYRAQSAINNKKFNFIIKGCERRVQGWEDRILEKLHHIDFKLKWVEVDKDLFPHETLKYSPIEIKEKRFLGEKKEFEEVLKKIIKDISRSDFILIR